MKTLIILLAIAGVIGWLAIGLFIAQGPQPEILLPAEVITKVGPLNITNTLITAWLTMAFLVVLSVIATRSMRLMPTGLQNFVEASVGFLVDQIEEVAGQENGRRFFAVVATIFIFVIVANWMALLPIFNSIGKTEDVGHEIFHEIQQHAEDGHAFSETEDFSAWVMEDAGWTVWAKPRAGEFDFEVGAGQEPGEALDRYIVALAEQFTSFEAEDAENPSAATVQAAAAALAADPSAPQLLAPGEAEGEGAHGIESPALGTEVAGIDFPDQKLALVVPFLRSTYSDLNNTLAIAIISFIMVEFWGLQTFGLGYLGKFFVSPFKRPFVIGSFVGALELLSEFIRIISFAFRLLGNIFAGEVLILMLTFLMPFLFVDIIYGLEIFVGFIQATVFALLTLVFAMMAVEHHDGEEHHEAHHGEEAAGDAHHSGAEQAL